MPDEHTPAPRLPLPEASLVKLPSETEQFLHNQAKEQEIRQQEIELERARQTNSFQYSERVLDRQSAFVMQESTLRHSRFKIGVAVTGSLSALLLVFLAVLALSGHEQLAGELVKDAVLLAGGGAGGYGLAKRKPHPMESPSGPPGSGPQDD